MEIKVSNEKNRPVLWLYGVIGANYGGFSPDDLRVALKEIPDKQEIELRIHSDGGSFPDSIAMHSMLTRRKGATHVVVDGKAYSGGSVIAQAGKTIAMHTGSWMMIHEARGLFEGTADEHREAAERLDAINDQLVQIYKPRWKGSDVQLRAALHAETWLRDSDAVDFGLADSVDGAMAVAAYVDSEKFGYRNTPEAVLQSKTDEEKGFPRLLAAETVLAQLLGEESV